MNTPATEGLLVSVLFQLTLIVAVARVAGMIASPIGQPRAMVEMLAGLMLGSTLFGYFLLYNFRRLFVRSTLPSTQ